MQRIDFNCDLGEGCGDDAAILPLISSASIACGGHAGDAASMREAIAACLRHGVAIGAHPSFVDRAHFGRRELSLPANELQASVIAQVSALRQACHDAGAVLAHVKPHGALYNLAARDAATAAVVAGAVKAVDPGLRLYALSGSLLADAGRALGLQVSEEVFAERRYDADGRLAPRGTPGAVIDGVDEAVAQVLGLVRDGVVIARDGTPVSLRADTLCLHGDRPDAVAFAAAIAAALRATGVEIGAWP